MTLVSLTLPSDGTTAKVADINNPLNALANVINGGIDDTNIAAGAAIAGSKIASGGITNTQLDTSISPITRGSESAFDFVASGCVWTADAAGSTRLASMTAGVVYIAGKRVAVSAVTSRTFTASKDVYMDVDNTGIITYTDGTTNAASPALAAGSIRLGIIVVGATSIATAASVNQGQQDRVLPIASSIPYAVTDSLGNLICPRDPNRRILGYRQIVADVAVTALAQATGLSVPVIVPTGRKIKASLFAWKIANGTAGRAWEVSIWDGVVSAGTRLAVAASLNATAGAPNSVTPTAITTPATNSKTYNVGLSNDGSGTVTMSASATAPAYLLIELS